MFRQCVIQVAIFAFLGIKLACYACYYMLDTELFITHKFVYIKHLELEGTPWVIVLIESNLEYTMNNNYLDSVQEL